MVTNVGKGEPKRTGNPAYDFGNKMKYCGKHYGGAIGNATSKAVKSSAVKKATNFVRKKMTVPQRKSIGKIISSLRNFL